MKFLTQQEVEDILIGCTILSTGGGGSLETGLDSIRREFTDGKEFRMLEFSEVQDNDWYTSPYFCGSIKPSDEMEVLTGEELPSAVRALEGHLGITFAGLVSIEYGGGNTGDCMAAAAHMGRCIVDADAAGRAVPELQFSTYYVTDKPIAPFSVTTAFGDEVIVKRVADDARAEALSRFMAVGSEGTVGMADHPIRGKELKASVVPNALSYAGSVGRARREAEAAGKNPIDAILGAAGGKVLFEGIVNAKGGWEIKDGFTFGDIYIDGQNGKECRIWYKNENMLCWIGGEVALTCPDLICVVDTATGYPITNPNCTEGRAVTVLGFPCHELWKTEKALSILNPRFFGFEETCVFLEQ